MARLVAGKLVVSSFEENSIEDAYSGLSLCRSSCDALLDYYALSRNGEDFFVEGELIPPGEFQENLIKALGHYFRGERTGSYVILRETFRSAREANIGSPVHPENSFLESTGVIQYIGEDVPLNPSTVTEFRGKVNQALEDLPEYVFWWKTYDALFKDVE